MRRPRLKALCALLLVCAAAQPAQAGSGQGVLALVNFARTQPQDFARAKRDRANADDLGEDGSALRADPDALNEAIGFLMRQNPLPPLH